MILTITVIIALLAGTMSWFLLPCLWRLLEERSLQARCASERAIVLSYDDGPCGTVTPRLLQKLADHSVKASFFCLGQSASSNASLARSVLAAGHDVGHHTYHHLNAWKCAPWSHIKDVHAGAAAVTAVGGSKHLFRAPYGKLSLATWFSCHRNDYRFCWWTIDPQDSLANPRSHDAILEEIREKQGGVVLLHDSDRYPSENHTEYVLELTDKIIALAKEEQFHIVPISTVL